ncbi:MAG: N,N-dimethylformamidase beta subunit family domain-containing protein [Jatrophihabitantaceae bacterium]
MWRAAVVALAVAVLAGCSASTPAAPGRTSSSSAPHAAPDPGPPTSNAGPSAAPQAWRIPAGRTGGIEGFADRTSVLAGQPVRLFVSTTSPTFRVLAFRMGWYGGELGRLTWTSAAVSGHRQPGAVLVAAGTRTVAAPWEPSLSVSTAGWAPGNYLLRLDGARGGERYVPLSVRTPSARGRVVLVSPVTTWQAYNLWGCCDLYQNGRADYAKRSYAVSFDRPYLAEDGAGEFLDRELPVLAQAEQLGLPLDYVTDIDIADVPDLFAGARAVISMGHDEYWSPGMRAAVTAARDAGTNLAFLGANAVYRRIRFASTAWGPDRLEINYKNEFLDPLLGKDNAQVTANWPSSPDPDPESSLLGAQYGCRLHGPNEPGVVADPSNWLFAGTHVHAVEQLPGLVGYEVDALQSRYTVPQHMQVLLHSPTHTCPGNTPPYADTTYYVAASGAGVFDAGTMDWACAAGDACSPSVPALTATVVRAATDNLLRAFALGPAGRTPRSHLSGGA